MNIILFNWDQVPSVVFTQYNVISKNGCAHHIFLLLVLLSDYSISQNVYPGLLRLL